MNKEKTPIWTHIMQMILRENHDAMSDRELADVIGVTVGAVQAKLKELDLRRPREKKQRHPKARSPRAISSKRLEKTVKPDEGPVAVRRHNESLKAASKMREDRKVLKTKPVDLSQMRSVRIDHKTIVYVKPGDDIEAIKKKYTRKFEKGAYSKIE